MNTKFVRCILVLTLCLGAVTAQAGFKITAVPKPGEVPTKIKLPHVGITLNIAPKGPLANVKNAAQRVVSQIPFGKNFDREMDKMAAGIRQSMDRKFMTSEQWAQERQAPYISGSEEGLVLSRITGLRDIHIPEVRVVSEDPFSDKLSEPFGQTIIGQLPFLPPGDKLVSHFDGGESLDLLVNSMPHEILESDPMSQDLLQLSLRVYELVAKDQYVLNTIEKGRPISWAVDIAIDDAILKTVRKTPLKGIVPLSESVFADTVEEVPGFSDAVRAVTFTEYMVKVNDLNFPFFGQHPHLNTQIVFLWHKLWTNELSPEIGQFLLKDYMYAPNARDIGAIMDAVYEDFLLKHKFPGINFGAELETLEKLCEDIKASDFKLPSQEFEEVRLGMEVTLLVRTLPSSPYWKELNEITRLKVDTMRKLLEGGLENDAQN